MGRDAESGPVATGVIARARSAAALVRLRPFDVGSEQGRSRERLRRVALTSIASAASRLIAAVCMLATVRITLEYLGVERFGLWMTVSSVIAMLGFADLGMGNGLLNLISRAHGREDPEAARGAVSSAFFVLGGISLTLLLAFAALYPFVPWAEWLNVRSARAVSEAAPAAAVLAVCFALNIPLGIVQRVQMGYQEGYAAHCWQAAGSFLGLLGVIAAVRAGAGLPVLILAVAGAPVLTALMNGIAQFGWNRSWLRPSISHFRWPVARQLASAGFMFLILQVMLLIGSAADYLILAHRLGQPAVATYSVVYRLFTLCMVAQFVTAPLWPAFGESMAREEYAWARRTLRRALKLSAAIGIAAGLPLLILGRPLIQLWLPNPAVMPSLLVLGGFSAWVLVGSVSGTLSAFLNSGPLLRPQVLIFTAASLAALGLKLLLVGPLGIAGVVWATVIAYSLLYVTPAIHLAGRMFRSLDSHGNAVPERAAL